jgi:hypothetical protein
LCKMDSWRSVQSPVLAAMKWVMGIWFKENFWIT